MSNFHESDIPATYSNPAAPVEIELPVDEIFFGEVSEHPNAGATEQNLGTTALDNLQ